MKKNHIIIMILVGIVFVMAVAFAAFSSILTINGTAHSDSEWNIEIIKIVSTDKRGGAENNGEPIASRTSATFKTTLVSPGDSMTYVVTVKNKGNIDAKLSKITRTDSNNPAIVFEITGINENDLLEAGAEQDLRVTVKYNEDVTSQPDELNSSLTVKLDYVQNK